MLFRSDFFLSSPGVTTGLTSWIICLRGCVSIAKEASAHIRSGPLGSLVAQGAKMEALTAGGTALQDNEDDQVRCLSDELHELRLLLPIVSTFLRNGFSK